ncbi:MAG: hypothetical protein KF807_00170 [Xanthobacteraceae bacterium]|nr:hypothetical protein [Xanthobacteraceae bacterium]
MARKPFHAFAIAIAFTTFIFEKAVSEDAAPEYRYLSEAAARHFKCSVLLPPATQTDESANRLGAVGFFKLEYLEQNAPTRYRGQIYSRVPQSPLCIPRKTELPIKKRYQDLGSLPNEMRIDEVKADLKFELSGILTALNITYENISAVLVGINDVWQYELYPTPRDNVMRDILSLQTEENDEYCAKTLKSPQAQMIYRVCTGQVTVGFYFKKAVKGNVLNIAIGNVKAGAGASWLKQQSAEAPCSAPVAASKKSEQKEAAADPKSQTKADQKKDEQLKTATPKGPAVALSVGDAKLTFSADGTPASNAAAATTPDSDTKLDDKKCYNIAKMQFAKDAVWGVDLTPQGTSWDSAYGIAQREMAKLKKKGAK